MVRILLFLFLLMMLTIYKINNVFKKIVYFINKQTKTPQKN